MILDWDDTLLASSYLAAHNIRLDSAPVDLSVPEDPAASMEERQLREVAVQIRELEQCVYSLLQASLAKATRTIIVTNAEHMVSNNPQPVADAADVLGVCARAEPLACCLCFGFLLLAFFCLRSSFVCVASACILSLSFSGCS